MVDIAVRKIHKMHEMMLAVEDCVISIKVREYSISLSAIEHPWYMNRMFVWHTSRRMRRYNRNVVLPRNSSSQ